MVHINLLFALFVPHRIQQHVHRTLGILLNFSVEDWYSHDNPQILCVCQHRLLTRLLGLTVEVRRVNGGIGLVGSSALFAVEDVIGGDVDQEDATAVAFLCKTARGLNLGDVRKKGDMRLKEEVYIETFHTLGVGRALVREAFGGTWGLFS